MMEDETPQTTLTLRDRLAMDRTTLANERTMLSYVRTAFGFVAGGVTLFKLFPTEFSSRILGFALVFVGVAIVAAGSVRFYSINRRLSRLAEKHEGAAD